MKTFFRSAPLGAIFFAAQAIVIQAFAAAITIESLPYDSSISGTEMIPSEDGTTGHVTITRLDAFIGGGDIPGDITKPPYNAACNGTSDDAAAFKAAMEAQIAIYVPPGVTCLWSTMDNYAINNPFAIYSVAYGGDRPTINIDSSVNLDLSEGAHAVVRNLRFINGGMLFREDNSNSATVAFECINVHFENTTNGCIETDNNSNEPANRSRSFVRIVETTNVNISGRFVLDMQAGHSTGMMILRNSFDDTQSVMRIGFVDNNNDVPLSGGAADGESRNWLTRNILVKNNVATNMFDSAGGSGETDACIDSHARNIIVRGNHCENLTSGNPNDIECIYSKSTNNIVIDNILVNCGMEQAAIAFKGSANGQAYPGCTQGACARNGIGALNKIEYEDDSQPSYGCFWQQSDVLLLYGNHGDGCTDNFSSQQNPHRHYGLIVDSNAVYNHGGDTVFKVNGNAGAALFSSNILWSFNAAVANGIEWLRLELNAGQTADDIMFVNNRGKFWDQAGESTRGIWAEADTSTSSIRNFIVSGNYFGPVDTCIDMDLNGSLTNMILDGNNLSNCSTPVLDNGNNVTNCLVANNQDYGGGIAGC